MEITSERFKDNATAALADPHLREALGMIETNFGRNRARVSIGVEHCPPIGVQC